MLIGLKIKGGLPSSKKKNCKQFLIHICCCFIRRNVGPPLIDNKLTKTIKGCQQMKRNLKNKRGEKFNLMKIFAHGIILNLTIGQEDNVFRDQENFI